LSILERRRFEKLAKTICIHGLSIRETAAQALQRKRKKGTHPPPLSTVKAATSRFGGSETIPLCRRKTSFCAVLAKISLQNAWNTNINDYFCCLFKDIHT